MRAARLQALRILNHPEDWQVCGGCEAIINVKRALCPHCKHYRHDRTAAALQRAITKALGDRRQESAANKHTTPAL